MPKIHFTPEPENDFSEFIETYYSRCRERCPEIEGCAGKWKYEDLIPGLSDFDTRFLTRSGLTADDWNRLSMEVAHVHLDLARERPDWARTLEHLPGVNLMWPELLGAENYYPEFGQWSFYHGDPDMIGAARATFQNSAWSEQDEIYHWKKIALYYERYNRTIDPPINLGPFESKYPLHSRFMHYLAPPLHSAVSLMDRRTTPGKLDAFERAREIFPDAATMDLVQEIIERHYESPEWYEEPRLTELDIRLEAYLRGAINTLLSRGTILDCAENPTPEVLRASVKTLPRGPALAVFFENIKFSRFMKGRLWFFAHDVAWFDSIPLIRIELGRMRKNFLMTPLEILGRELFGDSLTWDDVLDRLGGMGVPREPIVALRKFHRLADPETPTNEYKIRSFEIVEMYSDFLRAQEAVAMLVRR